MALPRNRGWLRHRVRPAWRRLVTRHPDLRSLRGLSVGSIEAGEAAMPNLVKPDDVEKVLAASSRNYRFTSPTVIEQAPLAVTELNGAILSGATGAVGVGGAVIAESILGPMHPERYRERRGARRIAGRVAGTVVPLIGDRSAGSNYFHWIIDVLPRAIALEHYTSSEPASIVVPEARRGFVDESINRLLNRYPIASVHDASSSGWFETQRLLLATYPRGDFSALLPSAVVRWLRSLFIDDEDAGKRPPGDQRLVYVHRRKPARRHIDNDASVIDLVTELGFESVELENLTVAEQAKLFSDAGVVVAGHGAGLANIVFSQGAEIVEFAAERLIAPHYAVLSQSTGNEYQPFWCESAPSGGYWVDIDRLAEVLNDVLEKRTQRARGDSMTKLSTPTKCDSCPPATP